MSAPNRSWQSSWANHYSSLHSPLSSSKLTRTLVSLSQAWIHRQKLEEGIQSTLIQQCRTMLVVNGRLVCGRQSPQIPIRIIDLEVIMLPMALWKKQQPRPICCSSQEIILRKSLKIKWRDRYTSCFTERSSVVFASHSSSSLWLWAVDIAFASCASSSTC